MQPLLAGGQHVTAWQDVHRSRRRTLYAAVAWSHPDTTARERAIRMVRSSAFLPLVALVHDHRAWWHRYYRKSLRVSTRSKNQP